MKIHLEDEPGRAATFLLNGHIVLETFGGMPTTRDDLIKQVTHARRLEAFAKGFDYTLKRISTIINIEDHINTRTEAKQQQFSRGLFDGMRGNGLADHTHSYSAGHEYGSALKHWADILRECESQEPK